MHGQDAHATFPPSMSTRRHFLQQTGLNLGAISLGSLLARDALGGVSSDFSRIAPKAKRVIFLTQSGGPSQLELYDYKPGLAKWAGTELPESVRQGQRLTTMTSNQKQLILPGITKFSRHGRSGATVSEWLPHIGSVADELCFIKSMVTDQINHAPAMTKFLTGHQLPGRPSFGAWSSYGLGSENENLPAFVVLTSGSGGQALQARYWGNGFLSATYQGVQLRSQGDPVLYVSNPPGLSGTARRQLLDSMQELNRKQLGALADPAIATHIDNYELAFRMQTSVPELMDLAQEPQSVLDLYGATPGKPSYANNCLLARRLAERGVRFIQLCHRDWDHHGGLPDGIKAQTKNTDQGSAALIKDLKQRGLLDETLVIWGGEFGRTAYSQGDITKNSFGRDHHPRCFSIWMAGGGIKPGTVIGQTDDFGYNIVANPVSAHDLHATMLHLMGIEHTKFTYRFEGRDFRLTDIHGELVTGLMA